MEEVIVLGERVYLKKSGVFGWNVVYPIKIDGKIHWRNLIAGRTWKNLILVGALVLILLGLINEYTTAIRIGNECLQTKTVFLP